MLSSVSSLSGAAALSLLGASNPATSSNTQPSTAQKLLQDVTGNTDDTFKAGKAIGKIIELVAGMNKSGMDKPFTMDGAKRTDNGDGSYSETKTGQGTVTSDEELEQKGLELSERLAQGTGPDAQLAKAYLAAYANGTIRKTDLSSEGVTTTMTVTKSYYADGSDRGQTGSWNTQGLDAFLKAHTVTGDDGTLRDKATGKYASIEQNGTKTSYVVY